MTTECKRIMLILHNLQVEMWNSIRLRKSVSKVSTISVVNKKDRNMKRFQYVIVSFSFQRQYYYFSNTLISHCLHDTYAHCTRLFSESVDRMKSKITFFTRKIAERPAKIMLKKSQRRKSYNKVSAYEAQHTAYTIHIILHCHYKHRLFLFSASKTWNYSLECRVGGY